ncbi:MAG: SDR family oxidoreductase [Anaerolineae bacterium]|nr:SDR family oxidoreductase [Anaerolineae bacterium]
MALVGSGTFPGQRPGLLAGALSGAAALGDGATRAGSHRDGASSGIGRALALAFARQGARVVLAARREDRLEDIRREIELYAPDVLVVPTDLAEDDQVVRLVQSTLAHFGRVDVLVNNAGITHNGYLHKQDPATLRQMVTLNLTAVVRLSQEVLPRMLYQRSGYIVNVGSAVAGLAPPMFSSYTATKSGLSGFF